MICNLKFIYITSHEENCFILRTIQTDPVGFQTSSTPSGRCHLDCLLLGRVWINVNHSVLTCDFTIPDALTKRIPDKYQNCNFSSFSGTCFHRYRDSSNNSASLKCVILAAHSFSTNIYWIAKICPKNLLLEDQIFEIVIWENYLPMHFLAS